MKSITAGGVVAVTLSLCGSAIAQQSAWADTEGPTVLIDAGHYNLVSGVQSHSAWLKEEGLGVRVLHGKFDTLSLTGIDVVITSSPSAPNNAVTGPWVDEKFEMAWQPPFPSAFSYEEIRVLHDWVTGGGGLVIVFDHMPVSNAMEALAAAFGVEVANGHAYDERMLRWENDHLVLNEAGAAFFRRTDGTLAEHPITDGRGPVERIDSVALGGGAAFRPVHGGQMLLGLRESFVSLLPEVPFRFLEDTPRQGIGGWWQGGVLRVGRGRLAVFSDLGILATRETVAVQPPPWDAWQVQNPQFFINTLRWISGQIEPGE